MKERSSLLQLTCPQSLSFWNRVSDEPKNPPECRLNYFCFFYRGRQFLIGTRRTVNEWRCFFVHFQSKPITRLTSPAWSTTDSKLSRPNSVLLGKLSDIGLGWGDWVRKKHASASGRHIFHYFSFFCICLNICEWIQ